jgi:hypothetical protein
MFYTPAGVIADGDMDGNADDDRGSVNVNSW